MSLLRNTYLLSIYYVVDMVVGTVMQMCLCIWKHMPDPGHEKCTEHPRRRIQRLTVWML